MNNFNSKTNKDELISAACECIDSVQLEVKRLREQQYVLLWIVATLLVYIVLL